MAKLYFKYGAMGSSKTATALITKYNYEERGMRVWLMKPAADRRDGEFTLRSRIGLTAQCEAIGPDCDLRRRYAEHDKVDVIIVDECQFLTGEQIDQLRELVDRENLPVLCFGLRTDFQTKLFPAAGGCLSWRTPSPRSRPSVTAGARPRPMHASAQTATSSPRATRSSSAATTAISPCAINAIRIISTNTERWNYSMERNEILSKVDHTLLAQTATWAEIRAICDDGMKYHTASVCIPASYVKQAKDYVGGKLAICTVIGFPNGYDTTKAKCFEAADAVENGADEVDMVINIGWVKDRRWGDLLEEIRAVKAACQGKLLKVIIETCLLTDDEKIKMCEIVSDSGADYIKTSTGFSTGGATFHDVELFAKHVKPGVKIKAAGGISSLDDAEKFIELGASRLGTSRVVKIVKKLEAEEK